MNTLIRTIKKPYWSHLLLIFLMSLSLFFNANSNDNFNIPLVHLSNRVNLGESVIAWGDTVKNLNTLPNNIKLGCVSAYTSTEHHGCIESSHVHIDYSNTAAYRFRLEKRSRVVDGVTYYLGISGNMVAGVRNFNTGNQGHHTKQPIHPNFNNSDILNEGYNFGPYQANYCGDLFKGCTLNAIVFFSGGSRLSLHVILPKDILNTSHYEFHNLPLAMLQLDVARWNGGKFNPILDSRRIELLFSGSIMVDRRCYVSTGQSQLSFPTIKSNMNNGVVGQAKLSVTSTCHNLGYQTSISLKFVPVSSSIEGNVMTLATSENGSRALGILFHPEHFPTQCEGGDSQPFFHYLLSGTHEPRISPSLFQQDIHFSLCKYGIPTPGRHTGALDMHVQWEN